MYIVYEETAGTKKAIGIANSESEAWLMCGQKNSVWKRAQGIRYDYEKYA